jgi:hypothetical protein
MDIVIPNILYDDRQFDDFPLLTEEMKNQGIRDYNICVPIMDNNVVKSINISQKKIVRDAKERGDKECIIFEQDIMFTADDAWEQFLKCKPELFDIYLGGSYLKDMDVKYVSPVTKVNSYIGHHCIIISERYYDRFLETNETEHIDSAQSGRGEFYLCYPMVALQRVGWSANNKVICDYNTGCGITEQDIYRG